MLASRTYPAFREAAIVTALLPPRLRADYHLTGTGAAAHAVGTGTRTAAPSARLDGHRAGSDVGHRRGPATDDSAAGHADRCGL